MTGGATVEKVQIKKETATEIFNDASFTMNKWHSNAKELGSNKDSPQIHDELSYAKQQFGTNPTSETKMLGVPWDKQNDTPKVAFPRDATQHTKREVL